MSNFMVGLERKVVVANNLNINVWVGGKGPSLLLLHGYPQTSQMWRKVAPKLLNEFSVVCPDLRGYGDTEKPHSGYDKRTMANDMTELMLNLGHKQYAVVGHDRGARVAHRLALDWPDYVKKLVVIDVVPTHTVFKHTNQVLATSYWHWFFFQALDLPEIMISQSPEPFLRYILRSWSVNADFIEEEMFREYLRAFTLPGTIRATLEDYRAAAGIDLEHDEADFDKKIRCPVLVLWSQANKTMGLFDVVKSWQEKAEKVEGESMNSGHFIPEEVPEELLNHLRSFLPNVEN